MKFACPNRPADILVKGVKEAHSEEGRPANADSETVCKKIKQRHIGGSNNRWRQR